MGGGDFKSSCPCPVLSNYARKDVLYLLKRFYFENLKGLTHQIINAWKWYQSKALGWHMLVQIFKKNQTLPLSLMGL
jgi:hypothetical protein